MRPTLLTRLRRGELPDFMVKLLITAAVILVALLIIVMIGKNLMGVAVP